MSEATVGQIVGFLRLNADQFFGEIDKAERKVDELGRKSPEVNVKVKTDTAGAETKLAAVDAAAKRADTSTKQLGKSSDGASKGLGAMATAVITLGPAMVPLAGAAVGLGGAFGGMGAAGILAIVGIKNEMKSGTALGGQYSTQISILKGNLDTLSHTAASGVLSAFQQDVANLQGQMPFLNGMVANFSTLLGRSSTNLLDGIIAGLHVLEPLLMSAGMYVDSLSARFASAAGGQGMQAFASYAQSVLPQVTAALESIVGAAVHLVAAFAPLGGGVVGELKMLSDVISAIPVDVLSAVATAATSVFLGFRAYGALATPIKAVGSAMAFLGASSETAAAGVRMLTVAAGAVGAIIAVATFLYSNHAEAVRKDQQAVDDYTTALRQSNGAIDDNVKATAFKQLQDDGAYAAAQRLGISLQLVTAAALGNVPASREVARQMGALAQAQAEADAGGKKTGRTFAETTSDLSVLTNGLAINTSQFERAKATQLLWAEAMGTTKAPTEAQTAALQRQASQLGMSSSALLTAMAAQNKQKDAATAATQAMQAEGDAAGLLKQAFDLLNGKGLALAQAQTSSAAATLTATAALKKNHAAMSLNTEAGIASRQALEQKASADQNVADAVSKATGKTTEGTAAYKASKAALEGTLRSQGLLTGKVQAYLDKLYSVSRLKVQPVKLDANDKPARAKIAATQAASDKVAKGRMIYIGAGNVKAMPVIADTQKSSDKVAKARLIYLAANNSGAVGVLRNTQSASDRVARSRLIYLSANGSQAIGVMRNVQAVADNLHGKTITITTVTNHVAGTTAGDVIGHGSRNANGGTIEGHAFGGTVGGRGGPRADDQPFMGPRGLVMLSSGEEVIKNGPAQKYRPLLKAINAGKFAGGGTIGAAGPAPDMTEIMALFAAGKVTAADVAAARARVGTARKSVTTATTSLHNYRVSAGAAGRSVRAARANLDSVEGGHMVGSGKNRHHVGPTAAQRRAAEDRLTSALEHQRKVNGQVSAAEDKLAAARKGVTKATKDANALTARYKTPAIDQFSSATKKSNKMSSSFLANLTTLASRGFTKLARSLLEDGSSDAQTIAAQAVKSVAKAKGLEADLKASAKTEAGMNALDDKLNGVNQPPAQLKPVTLKAGESLTIGGQVIKGGPTKVMPSPQAGGAAGYGQQSSQVHLSPDSLRQLVAGIASRPLTIDGKSLAQPMQTELVRGIR